MADGERWTTGDELSADRLNRMREGQGYLEGLPGGDGGDGFRFSGGTGYAQRRPQEFWIKLTGGGTSGAYDWTEQIPDDDGTWVDGGRSGTVADDDPAVEVGGNSALAVDGSVRAWAWRVPGARRLNFQMGLCDA